VIEDKKYHMIYMTTNTLNGKFYIGVHSTDDPEDGYLGSGRGISFAIKKYGKENFERTTLMFFPSRDLALEYESEIVTGG